MSMLTLPVAEPAPADVDDNLVHIVCCDENVALCGEDVSGWDDATGEDPADDDCPLCLIAEASDLPCRARFCRARQFGRALGRGLRGGR